MTEETREQIARDAKIIPYHSNPVKQAAIAMEHQHPIAFEAGRKEERIKTIKDCIQIVRNLQIVSVATPSAIHNNALHSVIKELEALKTEIKK
jgi:hypothetical protein